MLHKHTVTVSAQKAVNFYREIGRRERPSGILLFWIAEVPSVCPWPVSTERILCSSRFLFLDLPKQTLLLVAIPLSPVLCPVCCTSGTSSFPLPSFSYALFWETLTYILLHVCFHCCSERWFDSYCSKQMWHLCWPLDHFLPVVQNGHGVFPLWGCWCCQQADLKYSLPVGMQGFFHSA